MTSTNVLLVELDHGSLNALDLELLHALIGAFDTAPDDRPIVLTGAGRAFSAGVDLRHITDGGPTYIAEFLDALSACFLAIYDHRSPVIAAINGPAIAGRCVIAAATDRRLIATGPIGLTELAVGVPFPTSALEIMRSVLGLRTAELVLTARTLTPDQAQAIGLVDGVLATDDLLPRAIAMAQQLGALPHGVFTHIKRQLRGPTRERIARRAADDDDRIMQELWASHGVQDAVSRYMAQHSRR